MNKILSNILPDELIALTMYGEARGESIEGQVAVAHVIMNRATGDTSRVPAVCLKAKQFSCWNEDDPNYPKLIKLAEQLIAGTVIKNDIYNQCLYLARGVARNYLKDNTNKSINYLTFDLFNSSKRPRWAKIPINEPVKIGNHIFFSV